MAGHHFFRKVTIRRTHLRRHFTNEQILIDIFPYGIYFQLLFSLLAAPACHYFTRKAFIVMGTFSKLATFVIQYYAQPGSLLLMQLTQITYGLGMTTNLVFASYIFVISSEQDYQVMVSIFWTRRLNM
ncbi:unnamed protein product [Calypogeia fissa]